MDSGASFSRFGFAALTLPVLLLAAQPCQARQAEPAPTGAERPVPADQTSEPETGERPLDDEADPEVADADAAAQPVDILEFEIRGNTVLKMRDVEPTLARFAGPGRTVADVNAARKALEELYQERGYRTVTVDVPAQDIRNGVVRFQVNEARVGQVAVEGTRFYSKRGITSALPEVQPGSVPNFKTFQTQLAEVNERGGYDVVPVFRAGETPGTVDLDLNVAEENPINASLELNDQNSKSTERLRLTATAGFANLWGLGHSISGQYQIAPEEPDQVQVGSASYFVPLPQWDSSFVVYGVKSNTDVATLGGLTVLGDGVTIGSRFIKRFPARGRVLQTLTVGFDYKDFKDSLALGDLADETSFRYLPLTAVYRVLSSGASRTLDASLGVIGNTEGPFSDSEDFQEKRAGTDAAFVYAVGSAKADQVIVRSLLNATARMDFQLSAQPLISNQQFSAGGVGSVRGYRTAEILGDSGVSGTLQLDWTPSLALLSPRVDALVDLRLSAFADGAYVWLVDTNTDSDAWLGSVGLGLGLDVGEFLEIRTDLAYVLELRPGFRTEGFTIAPVDTDFGDFRVHFSTILKY